jgi:large subunit ribosomal protein L1
MAKKAELLEQAQKLGLDVTNKNTIAELEAALAGAQQPAEEPKEDKATVAKAGKRSAKAIAEAEEKEAKEERKVAAKEADKEDKPKQIQKVRSRLERRSKGYRKVAEQIEKDKAYNLAQALELATKTSPVKFDATVEIHIRLGVDPRQADQNIRDTIVMPAGTGKSVRVAVFADGDDVDKAKKAGADLAAADEFLQQLDKGMLDFDVLVATPKVMAKLGKYARVLGPKGLMPNPKSGTVTTDVAKAVKEAKAGRVEYRVDSTGIIHLGIGKVSFGASKLTENARSFLASVKGNKPSSIKGTYVKSLYVTTSMGPSITVETSEAN